MDKSLMKKVNEAVKIGKDGLKIGIRIADALEKLVDEPLIEIQQKPPQCPHCGAVNPDINILQQEAARGNITKFLLEASCGKCGKPLYGLSTGWILEGSREGVKLRTQLGVNDG